MSNEPQFTGRTDLHSVAELSVSPARVSEVRFESGSVTYWHSHEGGQVLAVLSGEGRYQEKGSDERNLAAGDIVVAGPGVEHWHGAAHGCSLVHVAISSGSTTWKDAPGQV